MSGAYQLSTVNIKDDNVSQREVALVGEHLADMPGVNVGTSWSRNYPNGQSIQESLGPFQTKRVVFQVIGLMNYWPKAIPEMTVSVKVI